ncbi:MAG TPA: ribonuclease [Rhodanobacter sp.]
MSKFKPLLLVLLASLVFAAVIWQRQPSVAARSTATSLDSSASALPAFLPPEAQPTLSKIASGGPFEHSQDGVVFGNYEGLLPKQPRGFYHEYTVETPGARDRGARRIITGGNPPLAYYYTDDHYNSFRRFRVNP